MHFIGDVHGRQDWKKQIDLNDINVFVGDYFDSFDITIEAQIENYKELIKLKKEHPYNIVLLIGNHDYHYIIDFERYSGFSIFTFQQVHEMLKEHIKEGLLQWTYRFELDGKDWIVSHAGLTNTWMNHNKIDIDTINATLSEDWTIPRWVGGGRSFYGDDNIQGPLWVRPMSLVHDLYPINQIVGHTAYDDIVCIEDGEYKTYLIDTNNQHYLEL